MNTLSIFPRLKTDLCKYLPTKPTFLKYSAVVVKKELPVEKKPVAETEISPEELLNTKSGKQYAMIKLVALFNIKPFLAQKIINDNSKLSKVPCELLEKNFNLCRSANIESKTIIKYPSILSHEDLEEKIDLIKTLKHDVNITASLLLVQNRHLNNFFRKDSATGIENRVNYFAKELKIPEVVVYESLVLKPFLRSLQMHKAKLTVDVLKARGIKNGDIIKDMWCLKYSPRLIAQRFDIADSFSVKLLKTWMVRGKMEIFDSYLKRKTENKLILGNNSLAEYLAERLICTPEVAQGLIERQPAIRNKSMKKLQEIIDFLFHEGFTPNHITRVPKILLHSVETSRKRLRELHFLGGKLDSVHILTKSHKQYMQYYEALLSKIKSSKLKGKKKILN